MRRSVALAALTVIALSLASSAASARLVATAGKGRFGEILQGPRLVGGQVAWLETRCLRCSALPYRNAVALKLTRIGGNPETVFSQRTFFDTSGGPVSSGHDIGGFDLSRTHVAIVERQESSDEASFGRSYVLRAGRRGERLPIIRVCDDYDYSGPSYSLGGNLLAVEGPECPVFEQQEASFELVDLSSGTVRVVTEPGRILSYLKVAGPYVLASYYSKTPDRGSTVVYDALGREVTRVMVPPYRRGRPVSSIAIQSNGALVTCVESRLTWYSPGDTEGTPAGGCATGAVIEADRVAYVVRYPGGRRVMVGSRAGDRRVLADLGNSQLREVDFDGTRIAYGLRNCRSEVDLFVQRLSAIPAEAPPSACPVRIASRGLRTDKRGRVRIALLSKYGSSGGLETFENHQLYIYRSFRVAPGRQVVTVRLSRADRRTLRRRGQMRVRVVLSIRDRAARQRKVSRVLTLSARK